LVFESERFFAGVGRVKAPLPALLSPGFARVRHTNISEQSFEIDIVVRHPWAGILYRQRGIFSHAPDSRGAP
jgi:hypothetical protein